MLKWKKRKEQLKSPRQLKCKKRKTNYRVDITKTKSEYYIGITSCNNQMLDKIISAKIRRTNVLQPSKSNKKRFKLNIVSHFKF